MQHTIANTTNTAQSIMHPANVKVGMVFTDQNSDGEQIHVLALRDSVRISRSDRFRIIGLDLNSSTVKAFRRSENDTISVTNLATRITISADVVSIHEGADPMLAERDAALEALNSDEPFDDDDTSEVTED